MKTAREWSKEYWGAAWMVSDERAIEARDAEHRAEFDALAKEFAKANGAIDGQLMEIERLKSELAEAKQLLREAYGRPITHAELDRYFATPPAESTPVLCKQHGREDCPRPDHVAPPDDIRERLDAFDRKLELVRRDAARYSTLEKWVELRISQFQSSLAALEAKGEPGTHPKGAKP